MELSVDNSWPGVNNLKSSFFPTISVKISRILSFAETPPPMIRVFAPKFLIAFSVLAIKTSTTESSNSLAIPSLIFWVSSGSFLTA
jgi:hypothetical protein